MDAWQHTFDATLKQRYGITSDDAGMDKDQLARYRDLEAKEAAYAYAEDYDLEPIGFWTK